MRYAILAAGLAAVLGLSACDSKKTDTAAASAPAAPKYVGRSQQTYQGQEMVDKIDTATVKVDKGGLEMDAEGSVPMAGYKNAVFLKRIYAAPPKDGIYEFDAVADKPASGAPAATPVDVKGDWGDYPKDRVKGIRVISKTNSVVAMLPPS